ncbi:MAG: hypothetical protein KH703_01415 [Campylobacter gracilis]|uniref:hypothetical protein n=1 Tax=Campylobacter gracilis TaxID=824 RepID=UPI0026F096F6|nr:hypothetical protein [Campylobacter gracilis]MBS6152072.1 hypothetical protein [Campylobacter gracilis]
MQFIVSQARKEGMISTGIDLFLAALPAVFIVVGYISYNEPKFVGDEINYIASGILIAFICVSAFLRLQALRKISALSGIKAATLYRNCIIICVCFFALALVLNYLYPREPDADGGQSDNPFAAIFGLALFVGVIYIIVAWFRINFSLARVSGVSTFRTYVWLCVGLFVLNILCNAAIIAIAISEPRTEQVSALAIAVVMLKLLLPFAALIITGIVHLLAWSKMERISAGV